MQDSYRNFSTEKKLKSILDTMEIPENKKEWNLVNLLWLNRNIKIRNSDNPNIEEALLIIKTGLKSEIKGILKER